MNGKIQTLISNLREAGELATARIIELKLTISEAKAIEHIQEVVADYSGIRAELCAAFLNEMNAVVSEEVFAAEALEIIASVTELSQEDYIQAVHWEGKNSMWSQRHIGDLLLGVHTSNHGFKNNPEFVGLIDISAGGLVRLNTKGVKFAKFINGALS